MARGAMGRPSTYTEERGRLICERIACGESLTSICRDPEMPSLDGVYGWRERHPDFAAAYARAREAQADTLADEILDIADDSTNDYVERRNKDGTTEMVVNDEALQRSRLRVDARKWRAAKLRPRVYGDSQRLEHTGADGAPLQVDGTVGLAIAAVHELRALRMTAGELPPPIEQAATPADTAGKDLL